MIINNEILKKVAEKSLQNAESLISDADLLREGKRHQRAYTLYQLSIEEVGKALSSVYLLISIDRTPKDIKEYKEGFRLHKYKFLFKGNPTKALIFLKSSIADTPDLLDNKKNKSLYTAIIGNEVKMPIDMITEQNMNEINSRAETRFGMGGALVRMLLENYEKLWDYQKENGSIKDMKFDVEAQAKIFWDEINDNP